MIVIVEIQHQHSHQLHPHGWRLQLEETIKVVICKMKSISTRARVRSDDFSPSTNSMITLLKSHHHHDRGWSEKGKFNFKVSIFRQLTFFFVPTLTSILLELQDLTWLFHSSTVELTMLWPRWETLWAVTDFGVWRRRRIFELLLNTRLKYF